MTLRAEHRTWLVGVLFLGAAFKPGGLQAQTPAGKPSLPVSEATDQGAAAALSFINSSFKANQIDSAMRAVDDFAREHSNDPQALIRLASLLAAHARHEQAAIFFTRVNELRPQSPDVLYNLGVAYYNLKRLDEATRALAEAADLDGRPAETHFSLGLIASERGDHENAIMEFKHAVARAPGRADYYSMVGQEYSKVGHWEGAAGANRRATELDPTQAIYFLRLGDALFRANHSEAATQAFERAAEIDPRLPEIHFLIGYVYKTQGQFEKARQHFERQLALTPDHVESLANLGALAVDQKRFTDAEKCLRQVLARDPDHVEANFEEGLMWFAMGRYDRSIDAFNRVLMLRPDHVQAQYELYLVLSRTRRDTSADAALAKWKQLEALDRQVRSEEVNLDRARQARWGGWTE